MPQGPANTGGGATAGLQHQGLLTLAAALLLTGAGILLGLFTRRRLGSRQ